jgi:hypothetical protein
MSFNISFTAPDAERAKAELCERNEASGGHMPEPLKKAAQEVIDAMPTPPQGYALNVATYGHIATGEGPSNITLSVQHITG